MSNRKKNNLRDERLLFLAPCRKDERESLYRELETVMQHHQSMPNRDRHRVVMMLQHKMAEKLTKEEKL